MIVLYTQPLCMPCKMTARHLDKAGVAYRTVDITQDPTGVEAVTGLGYQSTPVVTVDLPDGMDHWSGYRPDRLDALAYLERAVV